MKTIKNVSASAAIKCLQGGGRAWDRSGDKLRIKDERLECHHGHNWCPVNHANHFEDTYSIRPKLPDAGEGYELCERKDAEEQCSYLINVGGWNDWCQVNSTHAVDAYIYRRKFKKQVIEGRVIEEWLIHPMRESEDHIRFKVPGTNYVTHTAEWCVAQRHRFRGFLFITKDDKRIISASPVLPECGGDLGLRSGLYEEQFTGIIYANAVRMLSIKE